MSSSTVDQFRELDAEAFARVVARTWGEYGWEVVRPSEAELPPGTGDLTRPVEAGVVLFVRAANSRIILAVPGEAGEITASTLLGVYAEVAAPEDVIVVSAVGFDTGALSIADAYEIDIVGPETLSPLTESPPDVPSISD